jgi:hypothetical protein
MRSTAPVQLGCVHLHSAPDATGIQLDTSFGREFRDVLIRQRVSEVQAYAQDDQFSGVLPSFEGIIRANRHRFLPYQHVAESSQ